MIIVLRNDVISEIKTYVRKLELLHFEKILLLVIKNNTPEK